MATYNVVRAKHATLAAGIVDQVNLSGFPDAVKLTNRGATDIYYRFDGTDPVVAADDTYILQPGVAVKLKGRAAGMASIELISSGAAAYSVEAF